MKNSSKPTTGKIFNALRYSFASVFVVSSTFAVADQQGTSTLHISYAAQSSAYALTSSGSQSASIQSATNKGSEEAVKAPPYKKPVTLHQSAIQPCQTSLCCHIRTWVGAIASNSAINIKNHAANGRAQSDFVMRCAGSFCYRSV